MRKSCGERQRTGADISAGLNLSLRADIGTQAVQARYSRQDKLNKIIADRIKSEQKRWEKKAADEKAETERVAKMTADEMYPALYRRSPQDRAGSSMPPCTQCR